MERQGDVLVVGGGLAGLAAAWQAAVAGRGVRLVAKGWGATHWHAGTIDLLGYTPSSPGPVTNPAAALARLMAENGQHPYALAGMARIEAALEAFQALCRAVGYPLAGSPGRNWLLPTALGTARPTCLAPETMTAGDLSRPEPVLVVGFRPLLDFYPELIAANLEEQGVVATACTLELPSLRSRRTVTTLTLAEQCRHPSFRAELAAALKPNLGQVARVGLPAILGLEPSLAIHQDLQAQIGRPLFEIPGLPPSAPGMRLHRLLLQAIAGQGGQVLAGLAATRAETEAGQVRAVYTEAAARERPHRFAAYVLATGGILGGGIVTDHAGQVRETLFDLPVTAPPRREEWFRPDFLDGAGHPIYRAGLAVNRHFQPLDGQGQPLYANLFAAGTTLAHCDVVRERSFDGLALVTGFIAGNLAAAHAPG